jgi:hypothetical protein
MASAEPWLLQPKSIGGILSAAWRACLSWSGSAIGVVVVALLPACVMMAFAQFVSANLGVTKWAEGVQAGTISPTTMDVRALVLMGAYQVAMYIVLLASTFAAGAGVARLVAERAIGHLATAMSTFDWLLREVGRLLLGAMAYTVIWFGVMIVAAIVAAVAAAPMSIAMGAQAQQAGSQAKVAIQVVSTVAALIPVAIFAAYLAPAPPAAGVEGRGGWGSIGRAFGLVSGNYGRAFLVTVAAMAVAGLPSGGIGLAMQHFALKPLQASMGEANGALVAAIPSAVAMLLLSPFSSAAAAILYLDLRGRKTEESFSPADLALDLGYDVEGLPGSPMYASALSGAADAPEPSGSSSEQGPSST